MLNCSIVNSNILYKCASARTTRMKRYSNLDFRIQLLGQLIDGYKKHSKHPLCEPADVLLVDAENWNGYVSYRLSRVKTNAQISHQVLERKKRRCKVVLYATFIFVEMYTTFYSAITWFRNGDGILTECDINTKWKKSNWNI